MHICDFCTYKQIIMQPTIWATFLPFELVVLSVPCPSRAEAHQLSCDVCEAPLQASGALLPKITGERKQCCLYAYSYSSHENKWLSLTWDFLHQGKGLHFFFHEIIFKYIFNKKKTN